VRSRAPSPSPPESAFKLAQALPLAEMRRSREEKERKW
jgi:hypothetical protein